MALEQLGRPRSVALTVASTVITFTDVMDVMFDPNAGDIEAHFGGASPFPSTTLTNDKSKLSFKTTDLRAVNLLAKNLEVTSVTFVYEAPRVTPTPGSLVVGMQHAKELTVTLSCGVIEEAVKVQAGADGKPAEYEIKIMPTRLRASGADPTMTWALA